MPSARGHKRAQMLAVTLFEPVRPEPFDKLRTGYAPKARSRRVWDVSTSLAARATLNANGSFLHRHFQNESLPTFESAEPRTVHPRCPMRDDP